MPARQLATLRRSFAPAELFVGSFVILILAGSLVLGLVPGLYQQESLSWSEAVFTATSAVCVTGLTVVDRLCNAFFMSVTARTAGFNTIDYSQASDSTNLLTIILMMIGGSPGSTAGGMKTTTFAILGLLAWSRLRSSSTATFAGRSIPQDTIARATGLFVIATAIIVLGIFSLATIGDFMEAEQRFLTRFFEVVSAFNTVGLSMGLTPELSLPSRWVIIVLMFVGRIGPLSIASALIVHLSTRGRFRLAYEDVIVG